MLNNDGQLEFRENIREDVTYIEIATEDVEDVHPQKETKSSVETLQEVLHKNSAALKLSKDQCRQIEDIVNGFKTKQAINNNLMKLFRDSDRVGKITKVIKPFLNKKK